eukprot:COSAG01_NODE_3945_length_5507_cov_8.483173_3_plen_68_part_00
MYRHLDLEDDALGAQRVVVRIDRRVIVAWIQVSRVAGVPIQHEWREELRVQGSPGDRVLVLCDRRQR